jgi:REP element-mobilizing transposase RayT
MSCRLLFQEFPHHTKQCWRSHLWAYFAVNSGTITDETINEYINEQEVSWSRMTVDFQIDLT